MKALGHALAALACWLLRLAGRVLVVVARLALLLALPLVAWFLLRKARPTTAPAAPLSTEVLADEDAARVQSEVPLARTPVAQGSNSSLAVADRIVSLRLEPPVGVIHLRVYQARRLVRRELIVQEPCLRALLQGRRHPLPEVPYDPVQGLEAIKNQAVEAAEALINARGNAGRHRQPRAAVPRVGKAPSAPPTATANAGRQEPLRAAAPPISRPSPSATVAPQGGTGYSYVGILVKAGTTTVRPEGRASYEIFEATLQLDNGAELALRGAELQRELAACGCGLGERIAVTPMGKVPVALANGTEGRKNLYRVQRAQAVQTDPPK